MRARAGEALAVVPRWPQSQHQVSIRWPDPPRSALLLSEVPSAGPLPLRYFPVLGVGEGRDSVNPGLQPMMPGATCLDHL